MKSILAASLVLAGCAAALAAPSAGQQADASFRAGLAAEQAGDHQSAIRHYRSALSHSAAPRIKLELALSLLRAGEFSESRALFQAVYDEAETPLAVKRNIRPLMEEAELRLLRVRFGVRITSDSNPDKVSDGMTVYFNGLPMTYQPASTKRTAYGLEPWISVERLWDSGYMTSLNLNAQLFEDDALNSGTFGLAAGKRFERLGGVYIQAKIEGEYREGGSYVLPSVDVWKRVALNDSFTFGAGAQLGYMFAENQGISGGFYRPYVFADWEVTENAIAFGRIAVEHLNSSNDFYTYTKPQLQLGLDLQRADWNITPQFGLSYRKFSQYDSFWGVTREDVTYRPSLAISNDRVAFRGLKPEMNIFYEKTVSNIDINAYDQFGGFINIKRAY